MDRGSLFTYAGCLLAVMCFALFGALPAGAQDVVLNPGYIWGSLSITGRTISSGSVSASWTDPATHINHSASTNVSSGGSYTLTVNVPQGTTPNYNVYASANLSGGGSFSFPVQNVAVTAGNTSTANFSVNPGLVTGTVNVTGGTPTYMYLYGSGNGASSNGDSSGNTVTFPVYPGASITVYGAIYFQYGGVSLPSKTVSVGAGGSVSVSWDATAPPPPQVGTIAGSFQITGSVTPSSVNVQANGPSYGSVTPSGGSYSIPNLNAGNYTIYGSAYFGGNQYLSFPQGSFSPSRNVVVTGGQTATVNISAAESFLNGSLALTGSKTLADLSSFSMIVYGANNTAASGGVAQLGFSNPQNVVYNFVLTNGGWSPAAFNFQFKPQSGLNESLYYFDYERYYNPISLTAGETKTDNITLATGLVTVNFVALSGTFSSPSLSGSCYRRDQSNNVLSYYTVSASSSQSNVTSAAVSFAGMEGNCTLQARARVGSSTTTFGALSVNVVPDVTQVIDINGPALTVQSPAPNAVTANSTITVTGKANNEVVDITGVTVNGVSATLTSTNNSSQPHEVSFSAVIPLASGANQVQTIATAASGKTASDTRTVYRDNGPPALNWTPADGTVTNSNSATVAGTATDDGGIKSLTVNGNAVAITPGTSVSFSVPITLAVGENFITVVATDIANQSTSQTHKVTFATDTTPPVTTIGLTGTAGSGGWYNVRRDGYAVGC